jgi:hypothetical protein
LCGDDKLEGRACDDKIYGGSCTGDIEGRDGDAVLYGGPGNDSTVADNVIADGPLEITDVFGRPLEACTLRSVNIPRTPVNRAVGGSFARE